MAMKLHSMPTSTAYSLLDIKILLSAIKGWDWLVVRFSQVPQSPEMYNRINYAFSISISLI